MASHRIHRAEVELTVGDSAVASALIERTSGLFSRRIATLLDRVFGDMSGPERLDRLDRLEVDLGAVGVDTFEDDIIRALEPALRAALRAALGHGDDRLAPPRELLDAFARTGNLPWWVDPAARDPVGDAFAELADSAPDVLLESLRALADDPLALDRIAAHLRDAALSALIERRWPRAPRALSGALRLLAQDLAAAEAGPRRLESLRRAVLVALTSAEDVPDRVLHTVVREFAGTPDRTPHPLLGRADLPTFLRDVLLARVATSGSGDASAPPRDHEPTADPARSHDRSHDRTRSPDGSPPSGPPQDHAPPDDARLHADVDARPLADLSLDALFAPFDRLSLDPHDHHSSLPADLRDPEPHQLSPDPHAPRPAPPSDPYAPHSADPQDLSSPSSPDPHDLPAPPSNDPHDLHSFSSSDPHDLSAPPSNDPHDLSHPPSNDPHDLSHPPSNDPHDLSHPPSNDPTLPRSASGPTPADPTDPFDPSLADHRDPRLRVGLADRRGLPDAPGALDEPTDHLLATVDAPSVAATTPPRRDAGPRRADQRRPHDEPRPEPRRDREQRRREALARLDTLHVDDAGLVILWPFLERFFLRTDLLGEAGEFHDDPAVTQALALLSQLAREDPRPPEYLLPLGKLLCGRAPESGLALAAPPSDAQLDECEHLLRAVISHAKVLRDTSTAALRAAFLRRPGALTTRDGAWLLRVERRPHDVLLDRFPWSWQWVKLPWMSDPLQVEW